MSNVVERIHVVPCRCACGYRCGGPGHCKDWVSGACLSATDGKHFVVDCDHRWDGPEQSGDGWSSGTCSRCGDVRMFHDMRTGP